MSKKYQIKHERITEETVLDYIFKDTEVGLEQLKEFKSLDIPSIKDQIKEKKKGKFFMRCLVRDKDILIYNQQNNTKQPEEIVRQLYIKKLIDNYQYPLNRIKVEDKVVFGKNNEKKADIVVYKPDNVTPYLVVEVKRPDESGGVEQLKSYLNSKGAELGVWTNGQESFVLYRPYPKEFVDTLRDIPKEGESPKDLTETPLKYDELKRNYNFRIIIENLEELVLANSGENEFEEIFKLLFAKLYDEKQARKIRKSKEVHFRTMSTNQLTYERINDLFKKATEKWSGIFNLHDEIRLTPSHLSVVISPMEKIRLLGANLKIIDDAFEYLISKEAKGSKGQYFTPRHVIKMCVKILDPKPWEDILDPACGSGGFLIHSKEWLENEHFNNNKAKGQEYAKEHLWGIDFERRMVKVAKALMLIAGDGKAHIYKINSLDTQDWQSESNSALSIRHDFRKFLHKFQDSAKDRENKESFRFLDFDVILTNPPFAGNVKENSIKSHYQLAEKKNGGLQKTVNRDVLFLERCLQMLKPGSRMAIVLPQGDFNNTTKEYLREWVMNQARILAVVGLDVNTFKPHTGTKTSILFLQKWEEAEQIPEDYPIFMAVSQEPGKDSSGDYVYKKSKSGDLLYDEFDNLILKHDLDDVANEFKKFIKKHQISFN